MLPWWAWLLVSGCAAVAAATAGAYLVLRRSATGRRFLALSRRGKVRFGRALVSDSAVPRQARWLLGALALYLVFPFDLIPDAVPVLGQLDDIVIALLALALLVAFTPREVLERALEAGESYDARRYRGRSEVDRSAPMNCPSGHRKQ